LSSRISICAQGNCRNRNRNKKPKSKKPAIDSVDTSVPNLLTDEDDDVSIDSEDENLCHVNLAESNGRSLSFREVCSLAAQ